MNGYSIKKYLPEKCTVMETKRNNELINETRCTENIIKTADYLHYLENRFLNTPSGKGGIQLKITIIIRNTT
jgi:hypothetical protein